ncbi:zinc-binding alcohol dehydrogenase family protein [Paenibacillus periandrae]|uniref:zinc-binding alcohol dehydrogenase family protein n=1 Tax=Paenibacillus periandrae TaxID=1761741 RepID=UPI001F091F13|nr:zinc-binding alcohol dehydrogenase family protein [Paenibacillus periandrae]
MKTIVCVQPEQFEMTETELSVRRAGEALVKVRRIGVCGTDYHAYRGKQPYFEYPRILGHEIAGEIVDIDPNSRGIQKGDYVTVIPYLTCGNCVACRNGKGNCCIELKVIGCHVDGAMREYITVPEDYVVKAEGLSLEQIVIIEPMSIGLHAVNRAQVRRDEFVLVIGAGPIGLAAMKFAKLAGAKVIAMDINEDRLRFCQEWADVDDTIQATGDVIADLARVTEGSFPTTVIDATGNAKSMNSTFEYAAHGGKVVYVSLVQADITFYDPDFHKKELTLLGSRAATKEEFDYVIQCLRANQIHAEAFITHQAPIDQAIEQFQHWLSPPSGLIKALITL